MAITYIAPNFSIDTNCNIADLETLKGSAIATTDNLYVHSLATLTIEKSIACNILYINDNPAMNAAIKTGYIVSTTIGISITVHDTTNLGGLSGKTGTGNGYYKFEGTPNNNITLIANSSTASDFNVRACPNVYKYCTIQNFQFIALSNVYSIVENCNLINFLGTHNFRIYLSPLSFLNNSTTDPATGSNPASFEISFTVDFIRSIYANLSLIRTSNSITKLNPYFPVLIGTSYLDITLSNSPANSQLDRIEKNTKTIIGLQATLIKGE